MGGERVLVGRGPGQQGEPQSVRVRTGSRAQLPLGVRSVVLQVVPVERRISYIKGDIQHITTHSTAVQALSALSFLQRNSYINIYISTYI